MSHQEEIEECQESLFDMMEKCENRTLRTSTPTYSEEVGGSDDTVPPLDAVDLSNSALDEPSESARKAHTTIWVDQHFDGKSGEISDSEVPLTDSLISDIIFHHLRRRQGIRGFIEDIEYMMWLARDMGYLFPFELICLGFTLLCCYMGAHFWPLCPANSNIPRYVFFNGAIGTFSACAQVMDSLWKFTFRRDSKMWKYFCAFGIGWVAVITTLVEMTEFYTMSYSFNWNENNYCNETFYWFVYYKNIASGVLVSLAALIYIPSFDSDYY